MPVASNKSICGPARSFTVTYTSVLNSPIVTVKNVSPNSSPFSSPVGVTVAIAESFDVHTTEFCTSPTEPSLYTACTVRFCVVRQSTETSDGVTWIPVITASLTVTFTVLLMPSFVTIIVVEPTASPESSPSGDTVAISESFEIHVASPVIGDVVPSLYVAVAVNCKVWPFTTSTVSGVTWISVITASLTVTFTVLLMPFFVTVTVVEPTLSPVTKPSGVTVAVAASSDTHVTKSVSGDEVPSL